MKTLSKIYALLILANTCTQVNAQTYTICIGQSTVVTATNSSGLTSPTYSLNPGGLTSSNPTFVVTPASATTYTLYVTGFNSSSALVTTSNTVSVQVSDVVYSLVSSGAFTLGCASTSICPVNIVNAYSIPMAGAPLSYSFLPPGSSTVLPAGPLSNINVVNITVPGTWSVAVRDNVTSCTSWSTMNISLNNAAPVIGTISVSQNPLTCTTPTALVQVAPDPGAQFVWLWAGTPGAVPGTSVVISSNLMAPTTSLAATFTLQMTDNYNSCQSTTIVPVYQNIYAPNAAISGGSSSCADTIVLTNVSTTGIPFGFPTPLPVVATLWQGPSPQPTLAYSTSYKAYTSGTYTMSVMDMNNGCTDDATYNVIVGPAAAFTHTVTAGLAAFSNVSSGTNNNTSYFWDFGDGSTSTLENPTHAYLNGGSHLVKFKVKDPMWICADSVIQSVTVSGVPCVANSGFSMMPGGTPQVWNVIPDYPWNIAAASWNWGDGSSTNTLYTSHQYSAAGMYNICLSVTVSCVATSSTCTSYSVYRSSQQMSIVEINVIAPPLISGLQDADKNEFSWNIAPNPNAGNFNLQLQNAKSETMRVVIYDLTGRVMHDGNIDSASSEMSVCNADLLAGMYLVTLENGNLKSTKRMVVNR